MRRGARWVPLGLAFAALFFGCGKDSADTNDHTEHTKDSGHDDHGEEGEASGVTFKEGRGLQLTQEIVNALTLTTVETVERPISPEMDLTAQVFATTPKLLASARIRVDQANAIERAEFEGATLLRLDRSMVAASRYVDAIFALDVPTGLAVGEFVTVSLAPSPRTALAVPRSAILNTATGPFVYVFRDEAYLRTGVKLGARSTEYVEIVEGLSPGDRIVLSPVEQLWLAELRLTKGGGHSH